MARKAVATKIGMIGAAVGRRKRRGGVAIFASGGCVNIINIRLARGDNAIVASETRGCGLGMLERCRCPSRSRRSMASIAIVRGIHVTWRRCGLLASRDLIVVAREAGALYQIVIYRLGRCPACKTGVAVFACVCGNENVGSGFRRCLCAIVTREACTRYVGTNMVKRCTLPRRCGRMAIFAQG